MEIGTDAARIDGAVVELFEYFRFSGVSIPVDAQNPLRPDLPRKMLHPVMYSAVYSYIFWYMKNSDFTIDSKDSMLNFSSDMEKIHKEIESPCRMHGKISTTALHYNED